MEKNTLIAIVLSSLVIIGAFFVQTVFFPPEPFPGTTPTTAEAATALPVNEATLAPAAATALQQVFADSPTETLTEERIVLETDLVRVEFTNRGGDIISYKLKEHSDKDGLVEMADFVTERNRAFSVILGDANGQVIDQLYNVKRISDTAIGFYREMTILNSDGTQASFTLAKQYTFYPGDYMFKLDIIVDGKENMNGLAFGNAAYTIRTSPQIGPEWHPGEDKYEYRRFYYQLNGKKKTVTLKENQSRLITDKFTWSAVAGKYFTLIALPEVQLASGYLTTQTAVENQNTAQLFLTRSAYSGKMVTDTWRFYVGPRTERNLTKYNLVMNNAHGISDVGIDAVVESSGILGPLEIVLKILMEFFYKLIPNWGVSIILLTILMRMILFPLTKKSSQATLKMQELQPKIKEIQDKYKANPQKMNEEMAKFYKTAGYNPLSGCLPMLIQFPLIFAMYNLFNNYFEFRGALFIPGWIPDLSQGDSLMVLPFTVPFVNWTNLRLLPVLYVISQMIFGKVTQTPGAAQNNSSMKMMMYGMPLFFFFIFYNAPAGLLLYWTFSNLLTMAQQVIINRMMHNKKEIQKK